jgi:hypothetical protein
MENEGEIVSWKEMRRDYKKNTTVEVERRGTCLFVKNGNAAIRQNAKIDPNTPTGEDGRHLMLPSGHWSFVKE